MQHRFGPTASRLVIASLAVALLAGCSIAPPAQEPAAESSAPAAASAPAETTAPPEAEPEPEAAAPLALNADGLLGGNATVTDFEDGEPDVISAVSVGTLDADARTLPFVFRNNTSEAVSHVDATATVRDSAGAMVANGMSQGTTPAQIPPGGLGLAYIYLESGEVPEDADVEFNFDSMPADTSFYNTGDLRVTEWSATDTGFIGSATNESDAQQVGPFSVSTYCFDEAGTIERTFGDYTNEMEAAPGGTVSFTSDFYGDPCSSYLFGVTGYFE
ncbi:hypothetical protein AA0Z99_00250 [Agrococcus sp. 1P02AA]|uniref:hypothetical protein n=1 Tax=Agrococcus sp. 1P02AA TaxID=3132259 RepID=UPI0039A72E63